MKELPEVSKIVLKVIEGELWKQNNKGLEKYKKSIDDVEYDQYNWNVMVIEELVDGIQYVVKENLRLKEELDKTVKIEIFHGSINQFNESVETLINGMSEIPDVVVMHDELIKHISELANLKMLKLKYNEMFGGLEDEEDY